MDTRPAARHLGLVLLKPIAVSIRAVWSASPTEPIDAAEPSMARCSVSRKLVYCDPAAECMIKPGATGFKRRLTKA